IHGVNDTNYYLTATAVDADNHVTVSYSDALGRTTYALNESGTYGGTLTGTKLQTISYNALDKPTSVAVEDLTTSNTVTTNMGYNDLGWMTSLNDPDRGNHAYTFDADGRVIADAIGSRTIGYVYDLLGRLGCVQDAYPSSSPTGQCTGGNHLLQNTYDTSKLTVSGTTDYPKGRLTQSVALTIFADSTSATTTESFEHDIRGQLLAEQMSIGNLPGSWNVTTALPTYQVQNFYNDANQLIETQTSANGTTGYTTYTSYNATQGWLNGIGSTSNGTNLATFSYGVHSTVTDINFKTSANNGLIDDSFAYDRNLRVSSVTASWLAGSGSSGNVFTQTPTYDAASNITKLATTQVAVPGVTNSGGSETQVFCYDEQNRLVWAGNSGTPSCSGNGSTSVSGSIAAYSNSFSYTNLGQISQGSLAGSGNYLYLYCNSQPHELTGLYPTGTTCSNLSGAVYTSSYDSFGNVTSRTTANVTDTMNYDKLDRMTNWSSNATGQTQQEQYVYDANGNRALRRSTSGPSGSPTTTLTTYAFGLEEHTYTGAGVSTGNLYYYFLGGRLIGSFDGTNTIFYLTDMLGSIVSAFSNTASSAAIKGNQLFGPYGVSGTARYIAGAINTAKGFTGQYNDALTGLDYYDARYYDPVVGVFLSADVKQGNAQGMNPYGYVNGNPETHTDPTGLRIAPVCPTYSCNAPLTGDDLDTLCFMITRCQQQVANYNWDVFLQHLKDDFGWGVTIGEGLAGFGEFFFTGDPEGIQEAELRVEQETEQAAAEVEVLANAVPLNPKNTTDVTIARDFLSNDVGDATEAEAALIVKYEGIDLLKYRQKIKNPADGTLLGDIDVETPNTIIQVKGGGNWNNGRVVTQVTNTQNNLTMNPDGKPVVVYAPGLDDADLARALTSGLTVLTSQRQLIEYLQLFG
ncbi:MAG TPA: RHS repeat-associated core domain-containing protein, partial [Ktedonosporobacter sp.]|nr:RHS repeat-associated core domain-containing protein [Ktedonosporobacter sp.]